MKFWGFWVWYVRLILHWVLSPFIVLLNFHSCVQVFSKFYSLKLRTYIWLDSLLGYSRGVCHLDLVGNCVKCYSVSSLTSEFEKVQMQYVWCKYKIWYMKSRALFKARPTLYLISCAHGSRTCIKRKKITHGKKFYFRSQKCL